MLHLTTGKNPWDQHYFDSEFGDLRWGRAELLFKLPSLPSSKVRERWERVREVGPPWGPIWQDFKKR